MAFSAKTFAERLLSIKKIKVGFRMTLRVSFFSVSRKSKDLKKEKYTYISTLLTRVLTTEILYLYDLKILYLENGFWLHCTKWGDFSLGTFSCMKKFRAILFINITYRRCNFLSVESRKSKIIDFLFFAKIAILRGFLSIGGFI